VNPPFDDSELDLSYPGTWAYKVFGRDEKQLRAAIAAVVSELEHTIEISNRSRTGKYVSIGVEVTVRSNAERLSVFRALHDHADVLYVL